MVVDRIHVAPRRVGLPDLDESVADRLSVAVEDASSDDDPLAKGLASVLPCEVGVLRPYRYASKDRSRCFVKPLVRQSHRLVLGRAQLGGPIVGIEVGRFEIHVAHGP